MSNPLKCLQNPAVDVSSPQFLLSVLKSLTSAECDLQFTWLFVPTVEAVEALKAKLEETETNMHIDMSLAHMKGECESQAHLVVVDEGRWKLEEQFPIHLSNLSMFFIWAYEHNLHSLVTEYVRVLVDVCAGIHKMRQQAEKIYKDADIRVFRNKKGQLMEAIRFKGQDKAYAIRPYNNIAQF
ncbi:hypothetical protein WR25_09120 [Diploscapter pachys]|uniref:Uncharacterized protein n=1 Tax=Diploscapter pachys TaxID=2018661 RepID=A0A2A2LIA7_9BILA|nr:hypothetical protein WR25_09120 [Diploscapter pachys]